MLQSIYYKYDEALPPHKTNTINLHFYDKYYMTYLVKSSHVSLWLLGFPYYTVNAVLSIKQPYYAQFVKSPFYGIYNIILYFNIFWYILFNEEGVYIYLGTENDNPIAQGIYFEILF